MAHHPFLGFLPDYCADPANWQRDFEALTRQYWNAWGQALRAGAGPAPMSTAVPDWQEALGWWRNLASGGGDQANDVIERCNAQARLWFGQMQQVAAQFAGREHSAGQIVDAWKQALGAAGENPFAEIFHTLHRGSPLGLDQWFEQVSPLLDSWRREGSRWLSLPAFGIGREHQERVQALARMHMEYQNKSVEYGAVMAKAGQRAFELFEVKLGEHDAPGDQLSSARALFDLWIDVAEAAYAETALSEEFRNAYGALVNAQMRLRSGLQKEIELMSGLFGMPTRSEVDAAHRKVAELEREVRRLRNGVGGTGVRNSQQSESGIRKSGIREAGTRNSTLGDARGTARAKAKATPKTKAKAKAKTKAKAKAKAKVGAGGSARRGASKGVVRARAGAARRTGVASILDQIATPLAPSAQAASKRGES